MQILLIFPSEIESAEYKKHKIVEAYSKPCQISEVNLFSEKIFVKKLQVTCLTGLRLILQVSELLSDRVYLKQLITVGLKKNETYFLD